MKTKIKGLIKTLVFFALPLWSVLLTFFTFMSLADESMMMVFLFALVIGRSTLWISPIYLTVVSWIVGYKKTKKVLVCLLTNIILLAIDFIFFYWTYLLTGGWF